MQFDLYHYYERSTGPFRSLSNLSEDEANVVLDTLRAERKVFAANRPDGYVARRRELERTAREILVWKGGRPVRDTPHYMTVGACEWLASWYADGAYVRIPVGEFNTYTLSFSYGDLFPTFSDRVNDGKEYRRQVYTFEEILDVIRRYGLPQEWNAEGRFGPERYVEAHVWSDGPIRRFLPTR